MNNNYSFASPPVDLMRHWSRFQGDTDPEALWFRIAREAAEWGYQQCLGQYERAATELVWPDLETDND
jgi:hypothetical protein